MVKLAFWHKRSQIKEQPEQQQQPITVKVQQPRVQIEVKREEKPKLWKKVDKEKILKKLPLYNKYQQKKQATQFKYAQWKQSLKQLRVFGVGFQYGVCFGIPIGFYRFIKGRGSIRSLYRCPIGFGIVLGTALYTGTRTLDSLKKKE